MSPSRRPGNARGKWQVAHVESFAGGVFVRPPYSRAGRGVGSPPAPQNGAHHHAACEGARGGTRGVRGGAGKETIDKMNLYSYS